MGKPKYERSFQGYLITPEVYAKANELKDSSPDLHKDLMDSIRYEQKHLKAYLKGKTQFQWGWDVVQNKFGMKSRTPHMERVKFTLNALA